MLTQRYVFTIQKSEDWGSRVTEGHIWDFYYGTI